MKVLADYGPSQSLRITFIFFLFGLSLAVTACGTSGGDDDPPSILSVLIRGINGDGTETSPIADATCRLVDFNGSAIENLSQKPITAITDQNGVFLLQDVPLNVEGFIECTPPGFPRLALSTFVSTMGAVAGQELSDEDVLPQTTVVANLVRDYDEAFSDPSLSHVKAEHLDEITAHPDSNISQLAKGAVILFSEMLDNDIIDLPFSNFHSETVYGALEDLQVDNQLDGNLWKDGNKAYVKGQVENELIKQGLDLAIASSTGDLSGSVATTFGIILRDEPVFLFQPDEPIRETLTDSYYGFFEFNAIPAKQTQVFVLDRRVANLPVIGASVTDLGMLRVDPTSSATGTIKGQVTDQNDRPLDQRSVIALQDGQQVAGPIISDDNGNFELSSVPVGLTTVTTTPDYFTTPVSVRVLEGLSVKGVKIRIEVVY
jgi:hypothetical protein